MSKLNALNTTKIIAHETAVMEIIGCLKNINTYSSGSDPLMLSDDQLSMR